MKELFFTMILFVIGIYCGAQNISFESEEFRHPENWPERIAVLVSFDDFQRLSNRGITQVPPVQFHIEEGNHGLFNISYAFCNDAVSSWYTRRFLYSEKSNTYEFLVVQYGGITQKMRFVYHDRQVTAYIREYGIPGDTGWLPLGFVNDLAVNYTP